MYVFYNLYISYYIIYTYHIFGYFIHKLLSSNYYYYSLQIKFFMT